MNSIRCCISCILPCGALDVIRIVHSNGRVEEISRAIRAEEIMKAYPKHILRKPSSYSALSEDGDVPKIVVVPPDAELQRGKIYFLMPVVSVPDKQQQQQQQQQRSGSNNNNNTRKSSCKKKDQPEKDQPEKKQRINNTPTTTGTTRKNHHHHNHHHHRNNSNSNNSIAMTNVLISDRYLTEILSENKVSTQRDGRRGRVGVWRPHLESISEIPPCDV